MVAFLVTPAAVRKNRLQQTDNGGVNVERDVSSFHISLCLDRNTGVRQFYINKEYKACSRDYGWLVVAEGGETAKCTYERPPPDHLISMILYSATSSAARWNDAVTNGKLVQIMAQSL